MLSLVCSLGGFPRLVSCLNPPLVCHLKVKESDGVPLPSVNTLKSDQQFDGKLCAFFELFRGLSECEKLIVSKLLLQAFRFGCSQLHGEAIQPTRWS